MTRPRRQPAAALLDDDIPDPGDGRASEVRGLAFDGLPPSARGGGGAPLSSASNKPRGRGDSGGSCDDNAAWRTLRVGGVERWMSDDYIGNLFVDMCEVTKVMICRDRNTGGGGYALVEISTPSAAYGVVEKLGGEPLVAKNGLRLQVTWAGNSVEPPPGNAGGAGDGDRRPWKGREGSRERGGGRREGGAWASGEAVGGGDGLRRRRGDGTASAASDMEVSAHSRRGYSEEVCWAYVDPHDKVQVGFTSQDMQGWYEQGYFKADLRLALVRARPDMAKTPPMREFYTLSQWFPDLSRCFTYVPRF